MKNLRLLGTISCDSPLVLRGHGSCEAVVVVATRRLFPAVVLLLSGCVSEPDSGTRLRADAPLEAISANGLVSARLELSGAALRTGDNDFVLVLDDVRESQPVGLDRLVATMPGHGHFATPASIRDFDGGYRIEALPFEMSGIWELTCDVSVGKASDVVVFDVDVP